MPHTPSLMSLHLRYRLWIAEMNLDINIFRIFEDYLKEIDSKNNAAAVKTQIDLFRQQFINVRKDIDELRHEMHLLKMKLAAYSKAMKPLSYKAYQSDDHPVLMKRYRTFRKTFNKVKDEFRKFEVQS